MATVSSSMAPRIAISVWIEAGSPSEAVSWEKDAAKVSYAQSSSSQPNLTSSLRHTSLCTPAENRLPLFSEFFFQSSANAIIERRFQPRTV